MTQTYLNGRISIMSLAAPTQEDKRVLAALSDEDRRAVLIEALERAEKSGFSSQTPEQIRAEVKARIIPKAVKDT